jgi:putative SOS response-associated peptidase YedK
LVPATSFCEYDRSTIPPKPVWFIPQVSEPLFFFAGIWRVYEDTAGHGAPSQDRRLLFAILITPAAAIVDPIHHRLMPVVLLTRAQQETWLTGNFAEAVSLQLAPPAGTFRRVAIPA